MLILVYVHLHQTQSLAWSPRNNQDCIFEFNLSISASHCCLILVRLKVSGLLACGFGKGFCCCWSSPSFFWDLQKGQLGTQPHFSFFWLVACSSISGCAFRGGSAVSMVVSTFLFSATK